MWSGAFPFPFWPWDSLPPCPPISYPASAGFIGIPGPTCGHPKPLLFHGAQILPISLDGSMGPIHPVWGRVLVSSFPPAYASIHVAGTACMHRALGAPLLCNFTRNTVAIRGHVPDKSRSCASRCAVAKAQIATRAPCNIFHPLVQWERQRLASESSSGRRLWKSELGGRTLPQLEGRSLKNIRQHIPQMLTR